MLWRHENLDWGDLIKFPGLLQQQGTTHSEHRSPITRAVAIISCHHSEIQALKKVLQARFFLPLFSFFLASPFQRNRASLKCIKKTVKLCSTKYCSRSLIILDFPSGESFNPVHFLRLGHITSSFLFQGIPSIFNVSWDFICIQFPLHVLVWIVVT